MLYTALFTAKTQFFVDFRSFNDVHVHIASVALIWFQTSVELCTTEHKGANRTNRVGVPGLQRLYIRDNR